MRTSWALLAGLVVVLLSSTLAVAQSEKSQQSEPSGTQEKSDDTLWSDAATLPIGSARLVEYAGTESSRNRFWLDLASVTAAGQSIVRFSTVIESDSGVRNVRHEAIRCASKERKLLAIGRADGSWSVTANPSWSLIGDGSATNQGHTTLFRAFCFGGATVNSDKIRERLEGKIRAY